VGGPLPVLPNISRYAPHPFSPSLPLAFLLWDFVEMRFTFAIACNLKQLTRVAKLTKPLYHRGMCRAISGTTFELE